MGRYLDLAEAALREISTAEPYEKNELNEISAGAISAPPYEKNELNEKTPRQGEVVDLAEERARRAACIEHVGEGDIDERLAIQAESAVCCQCGESIEGKDPIPVTGGRFLHPGACYNAFLGFYRPNED